MDWNVIKNNLPSTPAFVIDENKIAKNLAELLEIKKLSGCKILYSIKALPLEAVLKQAKESIDGLSVSSLFEARLAKEILAEQGSIHITTPGLRNDEFQELVQLCSHVSFNSLSQYRRLTPDHNAASLGLRINPKLSFAHDPRFDPCRPFSKLGIELKSLNSIPDNISGLHFHTVFSNTNYVPLIKTVKLIEQHFSHQLTQLNWLNLGGGYLFNQIKDHQPFITLVKQLKDDYQLDVFIEPGKAIVGDAGYLVTTVIDRFNNEGKTIIVLDTSVNHNPEVFEYQNKPTLIEESKEKSKSCLLVGSSCLAGDIFGEYQFNKTPVVGDRLVFSEVGAYSLIKANRFNGYNLPDIYLLDKNYHVNCIKQHSYQQYRQQWTEQ